MENPLVQAQRIGLASACSETSDYRLRWKRRFDILLSLMLLLVFLLPMIFISIIGLVQFGHRILYSEMRGGLNGRPFRLYKFRTEKKNRKKTFFGAVISHMGLDELPQLFQILFGYMSVVGPRPHAVERDAINCVAFPSYSMRFQVRPGLTGLAQVRCLSDDRGEELREVIESDLEYIERCSLELDLWILLSTPIVVIIGH